MPKRRRVIGLPKRWTAEQAREALWAQERSGLSASAYARGEGLDPQRLYYWRRLLRDSDKGGGAGRPPFIEVVAAGAERQIEVVLRSERVLRACERIDPEVLSRLCAALEQAPC